MQLDLTIAEWNANGISRHLNEIEMFLKDNHIDILLVSETHISSKSYIRIRGFDIITANHPDDKARGGAAVIIKNSIKYETMEPVSEKFLQAAGVKVKCDSSNVSIYSVYFPPRFSVKCEQYERFFEKLGNKFIVCGDFNAKHPWWGSRLSNPKGKELYKCIFKNNYNTLSTGKPTYWPSDPAKIPDLLDFVVYSGIPDTSFDIAACEDISSDHSPFIVNYKTTPCLRLKTQKLLSTRTNIQSFKNWIENNLNLNTSIKTGEELDEAFEEFIRLIHEAAVSSTPREENITSNVRVTREIKNLIRVKRRLRKTWQRTRLPLDKKNFNRAARHLNLRLKELKNESVGIYLSNLTPSGNNEYKLWNATSNIKRPQKRNIPIKDLNGVWCRSDKSKVEAFQHYLEETFKPHSFCSGSDLREVTDFLDVACQMSRPIKPFTVREIENEIKQLNCKKSPGYDNIDSKVIKSLPKKAIIYLTMLYNATVRLTYFPTQWKYAKIIMVLKPNKPENVITSYRPISLLPVFSKLFERLFLKRLLPILETLNILPDHQFGFRHSHGTPEQCHRVVKEIRETLENKCYTSAVFLDVKQAFDRVWHDGLLFKLKQLLPAPFYLLLQSYLHKRKFYVNLNGEDSEIADIKAGVPQGSVLGPVLYTIFTSDMPTNSEVTIATYADDTAILGTSTSHIQASTIVQRQLSKMHHWLNKWNIKVNAEKSTHVTFSLRREDCPPVSLNGVIIPHSNSVKYLGLNIDRRLTWKDHIKLKRKQLDQQTKKMYWLLGKKSQLSLRNKILIYKAVLKPVWTYGIQLWGTASNSNIEILQRYQSKTLRMLVNAPWFVNNCNIHNDLAIPTIKKEINRYSTNYLNRLSNHPNVLAITLLDDTDEKRRLKRPHVLDLPFR